jgi:ABC-type uncharacterized transport system permease subunit
MDILDYSSYRWLPSILYLLLLIALSVKPKVRTESYLWNPLIQVGIFIILLIHGADLHNSVFTPDGFVFGFAQDLSLIAWVGLAFYWFQSWFLPIPSLRWLAVLFALICTTLPELYPGVLISARAVSDPWFKAHFIVANMAAGLLSLAALHAILMSVQDRALHRQLSIIPNRRIGHWLEDLPPLMTMENILFNMLYVGFVFLSLTVFSGIFFSQTLFGKPFVFDHKFVFGLLSWFLFAALVIARWRIGLRGRIAVRWVLGSYITLLLAYVGSNFVLEVILHRT